MAAKRNILISTMAALMFSILPAKAADQGVVQAIIPWEAEGRVFRVDTGTMMFLGAFTGVMYIESSKGEMHEAFVMCPIVQKLMVSEGATEAVGHCEITAAPDDVAYAEISCKGEVGSCRGTFSLTDGQGKFAGIKGKGALRVRSPMRELVTDMAAGASLRVASGLAVIKDLEYRTP